jgi:pimeloyl-ACP methyl ester carboxylesterase
VECTDGYLKTDDGYALYFVKYGSAAPSLFVPNGIYLCRDFERLAGRRGIVFYDVRNRGRSEAVSGAGIERGILHDVDDLDAVRRGFHVDRIDVLVHSYIATMPIVYALKHPTRVRRIVQMGPLSPFPGKEYPADLKCEDDVYRDVLAKLAQLEPERSTTHPVEFCHKFWSVLRPLYVADAVDAPKARWERCEEANERGALKYLVQTLLPSIKALNLTDDQLRSVDHPVLVVHGRKDRSAPYGGGRDWARALGNARLLTIDNAAHGPWIEAPDLVFGAIETFLEGEWPQTVETRSADAL